MTTRTIALRTGPFLLLALASCSKSDPPAPAASASAAAAPATASVALAPSASAAPAPPKAPAVGDEVFVYDPVLLERSADLMVYPTEKLFDAWDKA